MGFEALVNCGVHEHRQNRRSRAVDRHRHTGAGAAQIKAAIQHLHVIQRGNTHARVADLAVNVGPHSRIVAIQRDRIKSRRQPLGCHARAEQLEPGVGAKGIALTGKHTRWVFAFAFEGKGACGIGIAAGYVVQHQPLQDVALVMVGGQANFADRRAA